MDPENFEERHLLELHQKLKSLDKDYEDGYLTKKGYEMKRTYILEEFSTQQEHFLQNTNPFPTNNFSGPDNPKLAKEISPEDLPQLSNSSKNLLNFTAYPLESTNIIDTQSQNKNPTNDYKTPGKPLYQDDIPESDNKDPQKLEWTLGSDVYNQASGSDLDLFFSENLYSNLSGYKKSPRSALPDTPKEVRSDHSDNEERLLHQLISLRNQEYILGFDEDDNNVEKSSVFTSSDDDMEVISLKQLSQATDQKYSSIRAKKTKTGIAGGLGSDINNNGNLFQLENNSGSQGNRTSESLARVDSTSDRLNSNYLPPSKKASGDLENYNNLPIFRKISKPTLEKKGSSEQSLKEPLLINTDPQEQYISSYNSTAGSHVSRVYSISLSTNQDKVTDSEQNDLVSISDILKTLDINEPDDPNQDQNLNHQKTIHKEEKNKKKSNSTRKSLLGSSKEIETENKQDINHSIEKSSHSFENIKPSTISDQSFYNHPKSATPDFVPKSLFSSTVSQPNSLRTSQKDLMISNPKDLGPHPLSPTLNNDNSEKLPNTTFKLRKIQKKDSKKSSKSESNSGGDKESENHENDITLTNKVTKSPSNNKPTSFNDTKMANNVRSPRNVSSRKSNVNSIIYPRVQIKHVDNSKLQNLKKLGDIASVLRYRAENHPENVAYRSVDKNGVEIGKITWASLYRLSLQVHSLIQKQGIRHKGDRIALVYRRYEFIEFISSVYACFQGGFVAVPLVASDSLEDINHILKSTNSKLVLSTKPNIDALTNDIEQRSHGSKGTNSILSDSQWVNTSSISPDFGYSTASFTKLAPSDLAYIEFNKSSNGELKGVMVSHGALVAQCIEWVINSGMLGYNKGPMADTEAAKNESFRPNSMPSANTTQSQTGLGNLNVQGNINSASPSETPNNQATRSESMYSVSTIHSLGNRPQSGHSQKPLSPGYLESNKKLSQNGKSSYGSRIFNRFKKSSVPKMAIMSDRSNSSSNKNTDLLSPVLAQNNGLYDSNTTSILPSQSLNLIPIENKLDTDLSRPECDVLFLQVEPRQAFGLSVGIFTGTFAGNETIYISKNALENPGLYLRVLTKYRATIIVGDYGGLQKVLFMAADDPTSINNYNNLPLPNLSSLRLVLINTLSLDPEFHRTFNNVVLRRYGCPILQINETERRSVLTPICTLPEHGGILLLFGNNIDFDSEKLNLKSPLSNINSSGISVGTDIIEILLNREALLDEKISIASSYDYETSSTASDIAKMSVFGFPALQSTVAIVNPETSMLCDINSVGEIWVDSPYVGDGFWAMPRYSESIFTAQYIHKSNSNNGKSSQRFLRTGLMGGIVDGRILIFGYYEDRLRTSLVKRNTMWAESVFSVVHYAGEVLSVIKRNYTSASDGAVIEVEVNNSSYVSVFVELVQGNFSLQSVADDIGRLLYNRCNLTPYAIGLCNPGTLPRAYQYGAKTVNSLLTKQMWDSGKLKTIFVKFNTESLYLGLPQPLTKSTESRLLQNFPIDPSVSIFGKWLQQTGYEDNKLCLDDLSNSNLLEFTSISQLLVMRANQKPNDIAFSEFDISGRAVKSISFNKFLLRTSALMSYLNMKLLVNSGDYIIVSMNTSIEYVLAIHACISIGAIPIIINPVTINTITDDILTITTIVTKFKVKLILVDSTTEPVFVSRSPKIASMMRSLNISAFNFTNKEIKLNPKQVLGKGSCKPVIFGTKDSPAMVMSFNGIHPSMPNLVFMSNSNILNFCVQQKIDFQLKSNSPIIASVRSYNGYGLLHISALGVFVGCQTLILPPSTFFSNPFAWIGIVSRYKVKNPFSTIPMLEHMMNVLEQVNTYDKSSAEMQSAVRTELGPTITMNHVRNLIVAIEERVDPTIISKISTFMTRYQLKPNAVNPLYGSQLNVAISTRANLGIYPLTVCLDSAALRLRKVLLASSVLPNHQNLSPGGQRQVQNQVYSENSASTISLSHTGTSNGHIKGYVEEPTDIHSPRPVIIQDSGKVSGSTMVAVVNPETREALHVGEIGEIWVYSKSNAVNINKTGNVGGSGQGGNVDFGINGISKLSNPINGKISSYNFIRTGDFGFLYLDVDLRNKDAIQTEPFLFIVGKSADMVRINGYCHFRADIESTVQRVISLVYNSSEECVVIDTTLSRYPIKPSGNPSSVVRKSSMPLKLKSRTSSSAKSISMGKSGGTISRAPTYPDNDASSIGSFQNYSQTYGSQSYSSQTPYSYGMNSTENNPDLIKRYVAVVTVDNSIVAEGALGNLASLIFQSEFFATVEDNRKKVFAYTFEI
ncbi:hypothetical protein BB559_004385 [Furculomyces boomerangus]|uniref:DMAP1-binding domain-containing protein n=1 Tax=Furculomyces boomerangus TaxID=61424 RepID=A0A2T9YF13_9FUNG|nr:hypothetical protein BB559_004385 [Furculomyces boomerangus]